MSSNPSAPALNIAIVRGVVSSEPRVRELPSGGTVTNVEVTTRIDEEAISVPVVVHDRPVDLVAGDLVVATGHIARRFFRAGGVTQSRTELVASQLVKATRTKTADQAIAKVVATLAG